MGETVRRALDLEIDNEGRPDFSTFACTVVKSKERLLKMTTVQERVELVKKRTKDLTTGSSMMQDPSTSMKKKKAATPMRENLPSEEQPEDDETDSEDPQELTVFQSMENMHHLEEITLAKLARMGFRHYIWDSKIDSYFVFLAFLGGYDVMSAFALAMNKYGAAFCLTYLVSVFLIGFPLFYLEMALGQYSSYSAYNMFERIAPAMKGVGLLTLMLNFLVTVVDQMIVPYFGTLLFNSANIFEDHLPWHNCLNSYNHDKCWLLYQSCETIDTTTREVSQSIQKKLGLKYSQMGSFCQRNRLRLSEIDDHWDWQLTEAYRIPLHKWFNSEALGQHIFWNVKFTEKSVQYLTWPTYDWILYTFLSWAAVYLIYQTGKRVIGLLVKFTTIFTVATLATLLVTLFTHSVAEDNGTRYFSRITTIQVPEDDRLHMIISAVILTISSLKLGEGGVIYLGSRYPFQNPLGKDCLIIILASIFIPFTYAICHTFSLDSYLLQLMDYDQEKFIRLQKNANLAPFYSSGNRVFTLLIFLQSFRMWGEKEWPLMLLFSTMGMLTTIMNKVVRLDILITAILDIFPIFSERNGRQLLLHLLICLAFMTMFVFVRTDGLEHLIGLEGFTIPFVSGCVILAEVITVVYLYGGRRFLVNIMAMEAQRNQIYESKWSNLSTKLFVVAMWGIAIPAFMVYFLIYLATDEAEEVYKSYSNFPVVAAVCLISIIPFGATITLMDAYRRSGNLRLVFQPDAYLWTPRSVDDRLYAEMLERKYRVS